MTEKELKSLIGAAAYARMKAFAKAQKKQGLAPADVKKALTKKFGKKLKIVKSTLIISEIIDL